MNNTVIFAIIAVAALLYVYIDAWTNEKIILNEKQKRKMTAAINMVIVWAVISYFALGLTWVAFAAFTIPFILRYAFFDPFLNLLMNWKTNYTGTTSVIDLFSKKIKLPFGIRFIILGIFIVVLIFILK